MLKLSRKLKKFVKNRKFLKSTTLNNVVRIPKWNNVVRIPKITVLKIPKIVKIPKISKTVKIPYFSKKDRKYQRFLNKRQYQPKSRKKQIDYITSQIAKLKMKLYETLGKKEVKLDKRIISVTPKIPYKEIINKKEAEKIIENKITIMELEEDDRVENITTIDRLKEENNEILDVMRDERYGGEYKTKEGNISEKEMVEDFGGIPYNDMSDSLKNMFDNYAYAYFDDDLSKAINFYEEALEYVRNK